MAANESKQGPLPQLAPSSAAISKVASDAAAAAAAVALSRVPCHPLDTLKCKLQASSSASGAACLPFKSVVGAVKHTYMREGVAGFYRGFGVALTGALSLLRFNTDVPHPRYIGTMPAGVLYAIPLVRARSRVTCHSVQVLRVLRPVQERGLHTHERAALHRAHGQVDARSGVTVLPSTV
jgi:hypothetical protein